MNSMKKEIKWEGYMSNESEIRDSVGKRLYDPYDTKPWLIIATPKENLTVCTGDTVVLSDNVVSIKRLNSK
jgi:hypothetical protein